LLEKWVARDRGKCKIKLFSNCRDERGNWIFEGGIKQEESFG
jgi:hypothetical protein